MIDLLAISMVFLYYLTFIVYYQSLFFVKKHRVLQTLLILITVAASYICLNAWNLLLFNFPIVIIIMIIGLRFSTGMNWVQASYGGSTCAITIYCFRGILTAISSFIYNDLNFLHNANSYFVITLFAIPASLIFLIILRKTILTDDKLMKFLNNRSQLKLIVAYEFAAIVNLFFVNSGRYLSTNNSWYIEIALGACTLTLFVLIFAIHQSIRSIELLEYQWKTKALEDQYNRQLQHYKSYQQYTENFRTFRHDYKSIMGTLKSLIQANENENAVHVLEDIYDDMQKKSLVHKKYSDNVALDAILQDLANTCTKKEIRFSFNVFAPRNTSLSFLDKIRIFSNITNNAIEACEKLPASKRFIEITSKSDLQWITLEVVNSYDGHVIVRKGKFLTTKTKKNEHGLGLEIVRKIAESAGGFVVYNYESTKNIFLTRIHIPHLHDNLNKK